MKVDRPKHIREEEEMASMKLLMTISIILWMGYGRVPRIMQAR
jgi:hypothetical protein